MAKNSSRQEYVTARNFLHFILHFDGTTPENSTYVKELKRAIRAYENEPVSEKRIIDDDGIDGWTLVYPLPEWLESFDAADEYFQTDEYIKAPCCAWDCTGARFTSWYKIFKRAGRYWCYHRVCLDV